MTRLSKYRREKNRSFKSDPHSPLSEEQKGDFRGLAYYPENRDLRFGLPLERFDTPGGVHMQTSTGDHQHYYKLGLLRFKVDGEQAQLTVYGSHRGDTFIPFVDATRGSETYGAGRHLDLEWLGGDRFLLDFNLAYNPWCAYSPQYSCPIPPAENSLTVSIRAGEKNFNGH
jgi:uncharacterized protein (DUF1684 family)